jgi:hypothetical protein
VFVRSLEPEEAQRLVRITRTTKDRVRLRRAGIVLASVRGRSASEAAAMFAMKPQYAREVIHAFNEQGLAALDPKWSGGRPLLDRIPTFTLARGAREGLKTGSTRGRSTCR